MGGFKRDLWSWGYRLQCTKFTRNCGIFRSFVPGEHDNRSQPSRLLARWKRNVNLAPSGRDRPASYRELRCPARTERPVDIAATFKTLTARRRRWRETLQIGSRYICDRISELTPPPHGASSSSSPPSSPPTPPRRRPPRPHRPSSASCPRPPRLRPPWPPSPPPSAPS